MVLLNHNRLINQIYLELHPLNNKINLVYLERRTMLIMLEEACLERHLQLLAEDLVSEMPLLDYLEHLNHKDIEEALEMHKLREVIYLEQLQKLWV